MENKQIATSKNPMLIIVLIKGIALGLFGTCVTAGFLQIVKSYDSKLDDDDWVITMTSITWYAYIFAKTYLEWYRTKYYR